MSAPSSPTAGSPTAEPVTGPLTAEPVAGELVTVESVLRAHPDVADVVVFTTAGREPAASVAVAVPRSYCSPVDLRDYVWDAVAADALPDVLLTLPALPRHEDGDVDTLGIERDALDRPGAATFTDPGTPTEVAVAGIWRDVLGRRRIGADDNFLDLGGDSMTGILLLDQTNDTLGVDLSFDELLSLPSLRSLAAVIDERRP